MASDIGNSYDDKHIDFQITNIEYESGVSNRFKTTNGFINFSEEGVSTDNRTADFSYGRPSISVDSSGRFAKHEIIGGNTVRQKIGEEPLEVSVSGVCTEETARKLDGLRHAKYGTIKSKRLYGESVDCHFASVSTSPLDDGGAVEFFKDNTRGEFLYSYSLECVEVYFE